MKSKIGAISGSTKWTLGPTKIFLKIRATTHSFPHNYSFGSLTKRNIKFIVQTKTIPKRNIKTKTTPKRNIKSLIVPL